MKNRAQVLFVKAFGSLVGLVAVGYGSIMLFGRPTGRGPCRVNCGFHYAFIAVLGQPAYNLAYGLLWVGVGLALVVFLLVAFGRK